LNKRKKLENYNKRKG